MEHVHVKAATRRQHMHISEARHSLVAAHAARVCVRQHLVQQDLGWHLLWVLWGQALMPLGHMEGHLCQHVLPLICCSVIHVELHHNIILGLLGRYDIWQGHFKGGLAINDEHEALAVDGHPTPIAPAGGHRHLLYLQTILLLAEVLQLLQVPLPEANKVVCGTFLHAHTKLTSTCDPGPEDAGNISLLDLHYFATATRALPQQTVGADL
mmetsp:Transcript_9785/g.26514  ORF Transcript_9785/g.26514 Transcript_9785/m.26514 type:complete len:210 (-) Transcript_9785:183-812(-)